MFKEFFLREVYTGLKRPMVYIFFVLLGLLVFGAVASDNIVIGGSVGNVYKNAPHVITMYTTLLSFISLLIATAFFNNAALRDYQYGFSEILFSTPVSKSSYFFGRFFGALVLSTIPLLGIFLGVVVGTYLSPALGWIDSERMGPLYFSVFLNNYLLFILPNMFFAGSIIFALSNRWKSTVISFVGALAIIIAYSVSDTLMSDVDNETIAALADSFGVASYDQTAKYYTPSEKNTLGPTFGGVLLLNRIVWLLVGACVLLLSYFSFSFTTKHGKKKKLAGEIQQRQKQHFIKPSLERLFTTSLEWTQFKSFYKMNLLSIVKSTTFKTLFLFSVIILVTSFFGAFDYYGLKSYPITYKMMDNIEGTGLFTFIILIFFSGELIWRDREHHINEVVDATPHASFISLLAKTFSLLSIITFLYVFFVLISILYQLGNGFTNIEVGLYIKSFLIVYFPNYLFWSFFFVFIQVVVNNKYLGYFVSILCAFLMGLLFMMMDVSSNMLHIAGGPMLTYSDMNGFGPGILSSLWFDVYWLLIGVFALLIAGAIWVRGYAGSFKDRIHSAKKHFTGKYAMVSSIVGVLWLACAGFTYYNTQILNEYDTSDERRDLQVEYEKKYKKYQNMAIPQVTDAKYEIDIFPKDRKVDVKATLKLINNSSVGIDSIHFSLSDWEAKIGMDGAKEVYFDEELSYKIYELEQTLDPGESLSLEIITGVENKGFSNGVGNTDVVKNGTFLNNLSILPTIGYQARNELQSKNKRKKYGLGEKDRMPALVEDCNDLCNVNYLTQGASDWVNVETIISTSSEQIAVAPGSLRKEWEEDGRKYFHYISDHKSQNFYSFISADYEVERETWKGIDIEIYYDKKHPYNVADMVEAVKNSLGYYIENFGPYYHKQVRIVEFPRYASFAQAYPGTMPYSESIGFVTNLEGKENNIVDAVIAHEMAHQWWAHQEVSATMQGATMLTESFSEYSSLMVMKGLCTPIEMRDFLKYNHERYLKGRSRETDKEVPLNKVENQGHIHYGKGSLILFALQDYIGEDKVNNALKSFLEEFRYAEPPYPNTHDFMRHLRPVVPDSLSYLITDWIEEITLYDLRVKKASYVKVGEQYQVTMDIESAKMKADTMGVETKATIGDWIDIGAYADMDEERLIYQERVLINQDKMSFTFMLDTIPARAAIDPRRLLIERVYDDNSKSVEEAL